MTERTGAQLFVDTLESYGVSHVFGNPGTTELPVLDAIADSSLEYVLGLHEDVAVGAAAGYAATRRYHSHEDDDVLPVGVVNLHITPGLAHGLGNLYGAAWAGVPLVVTAGNHELDFRHSEPLLTGDLLKLAEQFCSFSAEVTSVESLPLLLKRAFREALTPPTGPVFLALPFDVMCEPTDAEPERMGPIPTLGAGDPSQLDAAAEALVAADSPVLVLGDEVARADAVADAVALAEASGARVHAEALSSEVDFPSDHEQWISALPPREGLMRMLQNSDTVCFVGCSTNTTLLSHGEPLVPEAATCIHVSPSGAEIGKHAPVDVALIADPGAAMAGIAARVAESLDDEVCEARIEKVGATKESLAATIRSMGEDDGGDDPRASKAELVDALAEVCPEAFVVDEGVTARFALQTRFPFQPGTFLSNKGGGLGYGLPASVGAAFAMRERAAEGGETRPVVGYVGDGSYLYYPNTLYTAARYGLDMTVVVPDNRNYRILKDNMAEAFGGTVEDYEFVGMDFDPPVDIPANAESHGASGHLVETREDVAGTIAAALDEAGPSVVDVLVHD